MKSTLRFFKRIVWLFFALVIAYQLWLFAHVLFWKWNNPAATSFMAIQLDELRNKNAQAELKHQWVGYEQISIHLKRAVVASEDDRFMDHSGFDVEGIRYALKKNKRLGASVAGGSTITQQLAKNLFLSPSRSYVRKAQEAVIAGMIELLWDKRRILEVYLNVVEWGNGVFGAEAAAQHYFKLPAAKLSAGQAAHIAVMLPNPRKFEKNYPPYVETHSRRVLARMHRSRVP
jgi:monofunctional biosynthetic peptidoglycan transglycosylase